MRWPKWTQKFAYCLAQRKIATQMSSEGVTISGQSNCLLVVKANLRQRIRKLKWVRLALRYDK